MDSMDEEAFSMALLLSIGSALPMTLKAAIDLNLLQLIKNSAPAPISASQLASQLPTNDPDRASKLIDRILRFLSGHSILISKLKHLPEGGDMERLYSLPPAVAKYLTADEDDGASLAPFCLMIQHKVMMDSWHHIKDAVLHGGFPFERAHGLKIFEYSVTDPIFNDVFNKAMHVFSSILMKKIVEEYKGFEGLESLVDVGGGTGASLKLILSKYPTIKAINFDLPHVVQRAPSYLGMEHIGGDMFVSIPIADAIFMKWICHDWSDAHCHKLLKNCYQSLPPEKGKVIMAEFILPEKPDCGFASNFDMLMMAYCEGGKERTIKEFEAMGKQVGFKKVEKVCSAYGMAIMEFHK